MAIEQETTVINDFEGDRQLLEAFLEYLRQDYIALSYDSLGYAYNAQRIRVHKDDIARRTEFFLQEFAPWITKIKHEHAICQCGVKQEDLVSLYGDHLYHPDMGHIIQCPQCHVYAFHMVPSHAQCTSCGHQTAIGIEEDEEDMRI